MTEEEKDTEQRIFDAACRVFQSKGYSGTRMQEIADEADINKSMLHYYYRSKDQLFQKVYRQKMTRYFQETFKVWDADLPLDEKVEQLIDTLYAFMKAYPKLPHFIMHEMNSNPERFRNFIKDIKIEFPHKFRQQIESEAEKGNIAKIDPSQLSHSIVALILFPFLGKTMVQGLRGEDDEEFAQFLEQRKQFLKDFILNGINYKKQ